jgi:hypothetical protein
MEDLGVWKTAEATSLNLSKGVFSMGNIIPRNDEDIKITPEMMEAGFRVLASSGLADDYLEGDKLLCAEIYRAMMRASIQDE